MTVHGAKGLEAPIVILADTTTPPAGPPMHPAAPAGAAGARRRAGHAGPASPGADQARGDRRRWQPRARRASSAARGRIPPAALCRDDARRRPADRLRRRSARTSDAAPAAGTTSCAHGLEATGELIEEPADVGDGTVRRFRKSRRMPAPTAPTQRPRAAHRRRSAGLADAAASPPEPARAAHAHAVALRRRHARSDRTAGRRRAQHALARGNARAPADAVAAGRPARAPRRGRAPLSCARQKRSRRGRARRDRAARCWRLLADPRFAPLFAPGSRAEVSIVGRVGGAAAVRPGRPAGGDAGRGADRRLQDQPPGAARASTRPVPASGLRRPARALPRGAGAALSRTGRCARRWSGPIRRI